MQLYSPEYLDQLTGTESLPINSTLMFHHTAIDGDLYVRSGANAINWSYKLNTSATPTIGGEVIQILSCFVGPITIQGIASGMTTDENDKLLRPAGWSDNSFTPADEMSKIVEWFTRYMHLAGGGRRRRVEEAIRFTYPARKWEFYIQVTDLQGFDLNREQVGVPWSITAEIVDDPGLDYFVSETMSQYTDSLTSRTSLQVAISKGFDFFNNPYLNPDINTEVGAVNLGTRMGDNFQALVAAWLYGDFNVLTDGYASLSDPKRQTGVDSPYDYYTQLVGGTYLGDPTKVRADYNAPFTGGGAETIVGDTSGAGSEPWIDGVLSALGFPRTQANICFMKAWAYYEDNRPANATSPTQAASRFNWLNSIRPMPGSTKVNSTGVRAYTSFEQGIKATSESINQENYYPDLIRGLRAGNPLDPATYAAMEYDLRTWGTGKLHYNDIKETADNCMNKALKQIPKTGSGLWKVSNSSNGEPYWGGSKEILDRFLAIAKNVASQRNASFGYSGKRENNTLSGGRCSDHWIAKTWAYAYDLNSDEATLDAIASAMASATGIAWDFKAKAYSGDWFNTTVNGYRFQIGWRQEDHAPGDNMHVHIGVTHGEQCP